MQCPLDLKAMPGIFIFESHLGDNLESNTEEWLLHGKLDRPAYFVVKTTSMQRMEEYAGVKFLRKEGGFAFYVREVVAE